MFLPRMEEEILGCHFWEWEGVGGRVGENESERVGELQHNLTLRSFTPSISQIPSTVSAHEQCGKHVGSGQKEAEERQWHLGSSV